MTVTQNLPGMLEEVAEFLASRPTREQLLNYHPSDRAQQRARELLAKNRASCLSEEERRELDQFEQTEILMQLVKAKARLAARQVPTP